MPGRVKGRHCRNRNATTYRHAQGGCVCPAVQPAGSPAAARGLRRGRESEARWQRPPRRSDWPLDDDVRPTRPLRSHSDLPFTELRLGFSGGAQAALATPTRCGVYETTSDFTPWSSPFIPDVFPTNSFPIDSGPDGSACPSFPLPFDPSMIAGSTTDQAGGFTNFSMLLTRGDGQQRIERLQFKAPDGLGGMLLKVPLSTNLQAEANACPASMIGHTVVESGPGRYPLVVPEPGQEAAPIYLTETYGGAPFSLSTVVPLRVGLFTLPTQRVRAKIEIDPHTAQITVTTDSSPRSWPAYRRICVRSMRYRTPGSCSTRRIVTPRCSPALLGVRPRRAWAVPVRARRSPARSRSVRALASNSRRNSWSRHRGIRAKRTGLACRRRCPTQTCRRARSRTSPP